MRYEKDKITGWQLAFSVACFIQASSLLSSFARTVVKQDVWFVGVAGLLIGLLILTCYTWIMSRFPDKSLIEVLRTVFGKFFGGIFALFYVWFFLTLTALNVFDLGTFVVLTMMPTTPPIIIIFLFGAVCTWIVQNGITGVAKFSMLFSILSYAVTFIVMIFALNIMEIENILPAFTLPVEKYAQGINITATIPFSEIVVFLVLTPNIQTEPAKFKRHMVTGYLIGGINFIILILRDIFILGNVGDILMNPSFETLKLVRVTEAFSRIEILFAAILSILLFFKICLLYYMTIILLAETFKVKAYRPFVYIGGMFMIGYSELLYPSEVEHLKGAVHVTTVIWILFEYLIPLGIMITAMARKMGTRPAPAIKKKKKETERASPAESAAPAGGGK
jgi:spore germination protein (amino acid permease)